MAGLEQRMERIQADEATGGRHARHQEFQNAREEYQLLLARRRAGLVTPRQFRNQCQSLDEKLVVVEAFFRTLDDKARIAARIGRQAKEFCARDPESPEGAALESLNSELGSAVEELLGRETYFSGRNYIARLDDLLRSLGARLDEFSDAGLDSELDDDADDALIRAVEQMEDTESVIHGDRSELCGREARNLDKQIRNLLGTAKFKPANRSTAVRMRAELSDCFNSGDYSSAAWKAVELLSYLRASALYESKDGSRQ